MKRFTDTDIWDKEWFMKLSCKQKCLIRFIFDKCDAAGVWSANWTLASAYIGEKITERDLIPFGNRIERLSDGKYFVPDFIEFQYGTLSENCKPHTKIISLLKKYDLYERVCKGYAKGIDTLEEKEEDKYKEEEKDIEGVVGGEEKPKKTKFTPPTIEQVTSYCSERKNSVDPQKFIDYYTSRGWEYKRGSPMKDWQAAIRTWEKNNFNNNEHSRLHISNQDYGQSTI